MIIKTLARSLLNRFQLKLVHSQQHLYGQVVENELEPEFLAFYEKCRPFTMTSLERMYAAYKAAVHIAQHQINGAVVECGVWKGGSSMMMAYALMSKGIKNKSIYLYDTFEGMPEPTEKDKGLDGNTAYATWKENQREKINEWCYSPLEVVQQNLFSTGYPPEKIHFVKGKVEDTLPSTLPDTVSLLRLDTDWYESTYHELLHLYPVLVEKGILIIDDYGHWQGAREAVDQYFRENNIPMLLNRIDYTGRIGIKIS
jgi:O-methyltransferase